MSSSETDTLDSRGDYPSTSILPVLKPDKSGYFTKLGFNNDTTIGVRKFPQTLTVVPGSTPTQLAFRKLPDRRVKKHIRFEKIRQGDSIENAIPIEDTVEPGTAKLVSNKRVRPVDEVALASRAAKRARQSTPKQQLIEKALEKSRRKIARLIERGQDLSSAPREFKFNDLVRLSVALGIVQRCVNDNNYVANELASISLQMACLDNIAKEDEITGKILAAKGAESDKVLHAKLDSYMDSIQRLKHIWVPRYGASTDLLERLRSLKYQYAVLEFKTLVIRKHIDILKLLELCVDEQGMSMFNYLECTNVENIGNDVKKNIETQTPHVLQMEANLVSVNSDIHSTSTKLYMSQDLRKVGFSDFGSSISLFDASNFSDGAREELNNYVNYTARNSLWTLFEPFFKYMIDMVRYSLDCKADYLSRLYTGSKSNTLSDEDKKQLMARIDAETDNIKLRRHKLHLVRNWFLEVWHMI